MLMIGVMPLPALMNSSLSGSGSGSRKSPSTPPRETIVPGRPRRTRYGDTLPSSTLLTVMLISPSGRAGSEVSEYARQCRTPSMSSPIRRYWPGSWPPQRYPGLISTVAASGVSRSIDSTRPRSSRVDHRGLISSR